MKHLTDWYPPEIKPVRSGVYKTSFMGRDGTLFSGYSYWLGYGWSNQWDKPENVVNLSSEMAVQEKKWQGLTENQYPSDGTT